MASAHGIKASLHPVEGPLAGVVGSWSSDWDDDSCVVGPFDSAGSWVLQDGGGPLGSTPSGLSNRGAGYPPATPKSFAPRLVPGSGQHFQIVRGSPKAQSTALGGEPGLPATPFPKG